MTPLSHCAATSTTSNGKLDAGWREYQISGDSELLNWHHDGNEWIITNDDSKHLAPDAALAEAMSKECRAEKDGSPGRTDARAVRFAVGVALVADDGCWFRQSRPRVHRTPRS